MPQFYEDMAKAIDDWTAQSGASLSPAARRQIEELISQAEQQLGHQTLGADSRPRTNLLTLLEAAKDVSTTPTIEQQAVARSLNVLCPLFPFCK